MMRHHSRTCGIDLGGTSIRVGLYDDTMRLIDSLSMPTRVSAGPQSAVAAMREALESLCRKHPGEQVLGVGIGSPGPINLRTGVLGLLPNLPGWENFPLRDALSEAVGIPVLLESDANAAAIAEWKMGAGQSAGLDSLAMMTLGTGVGSGLILNGRVWHGMFGMGGEVGHSVIDPEGELCGCGTRGCLEMYASANGLLRLAKRVSEGHGATVALRTLIASGNGFTARQVAELADRGDEAARLAFEQLGAFLGLGIANLISTLDLPMIIVGGGLASAWPLFAPAMFQAVRHNSVVYRLVQPSQLDAREEDRTFIVPARLGPAAGLLGAALLPRIMDGAPTHNATLTREITR